MAANSGEAHASASNTPTPMRELHDGGAGCAVAGAGAGCAVAAGGDDEGSAIGRRRRSPSFSAWSDAAAAAVSMFVPLVLSLSHCSSGCVVFWFLV